MKEEGATTAKARKKRVWAYALLGCMPLALTACGDSDVEPTAYEECEFEREKNGRWEIDCDDDGSSGGGSGSSGSSSSNWYVMNGYSSKSSYAKKGTSFYNSYSGIGKSGYSSGG
ncbi:hypothetical protein NQ117_06005 [Paenibacillus sp. SC116]|uniref:hypothetical protein n=1 Tax=Paenibacillus sp. SC116 TaxID=2968986 RepID=UPI00215AF931|nr:hypothetical protein [Paenibacillus sp. SC116]MCR8843229.1 hypothetical protein [Paenibacillus sp. SC116]